MKKGRIKKRWFGHVGCALYIHSDCVCHLACMHELAQAYVVGILLGRGVGRDDQDERW